MIWCVVQWRGDVPEDRVRHGLCIITIHPETTVRGQHCYRDYLEGKVVNSSFDPGKERYIVGRRSD